MDEMHAKQHAQRHNEGTMEEEDTKHPAKTQDKTKEQRKIEHTQRQETTAAKRRAEGAARKAARLGTAPGDHGLPNNGATPPINTTPPSTLPNLTLTPPTIPYILPPLNTTDTTIDPNLANPTGDDDKDIFLDPNQGEDEENLDEVLDLNSQNDSNQSKTISGVKELQEQQPEDDASSAKNPRKGKARWGFPVSEKLLM
jgi:hypothetical protein